MEYQFHFGRRFYRDSKAGYWISTTCPKIRAHVWVWQVFNGRCPKGYHIHHKDRNRSNNNISNLELLSVREHLSRHMTVEKKQRSAEHANKIRLLAKVWHASEEGREWHRKHGIIAWNNRKPFVGICKKCSRQFMTKTHHQSFCSNNCKSSQRRASKTDDIDLVCPVCNKMFKRSRYAKSKTCGRACGGVFKSKEYKRRWG